RRLEWRAVFGYQDLPRQAGDQPMLAPAPASPESAGMSQSALDRLEHHLKQRYIDAGRFPGTQVLIYRRGKIVHSTVQGFADLERKRPVKAHTSFRINQ